MEINNQSSLQSATHTETRTTHDGDVALHTGPQQHGKTILVAEAPVSTHQLYQPTPFDAEVNNNVLAYLSRPTVYTSSYFVNGGIGNLIAINLTPSFLRSYLSNLTGAYAFRCTVCFRLEITASPQVSGIVKMAHFPCVASTDAKWIWRTSMSQVPNVEVNLAEAAAAELKIPFIADVDFFTMTPSIFDYSTMGQFVVTPYLPVAWDSTTATTPTFALYIWFEDVVPINKAAPVVTVTPQSSEAVGPISKWFAAGAKVATYAGSIPLISSYAAPLGWVLDAGARVLAHFGWSKPNVPCYSGVMGMAMTRGVNTCYDQDQAQPLAFYSSNAVEPINFANTDLDEMSICYLTCKPSAIAAFVVQTGNTAGTVKWTCPVSPAAFVFQSSASGFAQQYSYSLGAFTGTTAPTFLPSTLAFVASHFNYWRGDLVFRFKIAATKFHSGKLLFGFSPAVDSANSTAPLSNVRYDYASIVLDIRSATEVDLLVPFVYPSKFCSTNFSPKTYDTSSGFVGTWGATHNTGTVFCRVIDTIYGPDNVPQSIPVMVEVFSKCGLEFSVPHASSFITSGDGVSVVAQGSEDVIHFESAKRCVGERILSIKQLCMRPYWQLTSFAANTPTILPGSSINGATYPTPTTTGGTHPIGLYSTEPSIVQHFASLYSLVRGSLMVRVVPSTTSSGSARTFVSTITAVDSGTDVYDIHHSPISFEHNMVNSCVVPFYAQHHRVFTGFGNTAALATRQLFANVGGQDTECLYGVSAGDDFQFGCFSGVPLCTYKVIRNDVATDFYNLSKTRPA